MEHKNSPFVPKRESTVPLRCQRAAITCWLWLLLRTLAMGVILCRPELWQDWQEALFVQRNSLLLKALCSFASPEAEPPYSGRLATQLFLNHNNHQILYWSWGISHNVRNAQTLSVTDLLRLCLLQFGCSLLRGGGWDVSEVPLGFFKAFWGLFQPILWSNTSQDWGQEKAALHKPSPTCAGMPDAGGTDVAPAPPMLMLAHLHFS